MLTAFGASRNFTAVGTRRKLGLNMPKMGGHYAAVVMQNGLGIFPVSPTEYKNGTV